MSALHWKGLLRALPLWTLAVLLSGSLGCGLTEPPPDSKPLVKDQEAVRDAVALAMENEDCCLEGGRDGADPEELARERREWEGHQRLMAEKEAAHQAVLEQWRRERAKREETVPGQKVSGLGEPASAEAMKTWHAAYTPKAAPVRSALARYLPVVKKTDLDTQEICRGLLGSTTALLEDQTALDAPDRKVGRALADAYREFQGAARACLAANPLEAHFRLQDGEAALGRAASLLEAYSLRP